MASKYRGVEQLVARRAHNPKVVGSSPSPATRKTPKSLDFGAFFCHFGTFLTHLKISSNTFSNTSSNKALFFKASKYFVSAEILYFYMVKYNGGSLSEKVCAIFK